MVAAPGRVNIIGEHTDYNDGFVLPMAIERWTVLAGSPNRGGKATLFSQATDSTATIELAQPVQKAEPAWANYVRGVVAGFQHRGLHIEGFDALLESTVPLGSGLSSSAALEVASATLLEAITQHTLDPIEKALLCQKAEHVFAGVPCGIMDQFTSALARENHLLLLDCRSRAVELVPMTDPEVAVLIINTNVRHSLASGEYGRRRAQCESAAKTLRVASLRDATMEVLRSAQDRLDPVDFRRARHVIGEIERTLAAAKAIAASDWEKVGDLMYASHASLRDDYEVSCEELDEVVEIARGIGAAGGVIGCRMTGGGFGGCAVSLVRAGQVEAITRKLGQDYQQRTDIEPTMFVSRPAAGAQVIT
jgi:galactokinase